MLENAGGWFCCAGGGYKSGLCVVVGYTYRTRFLPGWVDSLSNMRCKFHPSPLNIVLDDQAAYLPIVLFFASEAS